MIYIIEETSFISAVLDSNDLFHEDAIKTFQIFSLFKNNIKVIIPPLCIRNCIT